MCTVYCGDISSITVTLVWCGLSPWCRFGNQCKAASVCARVWYGLSPELAIEGHARIGMVGSGIECSLLECSLLDQEDEPGPIIAWYITLTLMVW